jgi:hypothetical protein
MSQRPASAHAVPLAAPVVAPLGADDSEDGMRLLAAAVPLSLLIDLVLPTPSTEILAREGGDTRWITHVA